MSVKLVYLELTPGNSPFLKWEKKLDITLRAAVRIRLNRIRLDNFGDCKRIKGAKGLYELRIHHGPGLRMYFGKEKDSMVVLLCGGNKGSQKEIFTRPKSTGISLK